MANKLLSFHVWSVPYATVCEPEKIRTYVKAEVIRQNVNRIYSELTLSSIERLNRVIQNAPLLTGRLDPYGIDVHVVVRAG